MENIDRLKNAFKAACSLYNAMRNNDTVDKRTTSHATFSIAHDIAQYVAATDIEIISQFQSIARQFDCPVFEVSKDEKH